MDDFEGNIPSVGSREADLRTNSRHPKAPGPIRVARRNR